MTIKANDIKTVHRAAAEDIESWVRRLFAAGDAKDVDAVVQFYSLDTSFRFGNAAPIHGRQAVWDLLSSRPDAASKVEHELLGIWTGKDGDYDVVAAEAYVSYTVPGRGRITVPCTSTMRRGKDGLIADYRVFIDTTPAFGPGGAFGQ